MGKFAIHPLLKEIAALFAAEGRELYLVGGAVRDLLRGETPHDWDLATDAAPQEVSALFRRRRCRVIPTGIQHGTVTAHYRGRDLEITTFRTESDYRDGRRPEKVVFAPTIEEDLSRRDFTMNAAALRLPGGVLTDPFGGAADIGRRVIRCVGNPEERFAEDGLRPLRALRFASQLGFEVEEATLRAIPGALAVTAQVSAERVRDELCRVLNSPQPSTALRLMEQTGLLALLLPELRDCRGVEQKGRHRFDVLDHSLLACDYAAREAYPLTVRLAALLHDAGKPAAAATGDDGVRTFYRHEKISAELARNILTRLRCPNAVTGRVCHLIDCHMFHYGEDWGDAAVRRFIIRVGEENLEDLYRLRRADAYATAGVEAAAGTGGAAGMDAAGTDAAGTDAADSLLPLAARVDAALAQDQALSLKDLAVSGKDLIAAGIKPGRHMGIILNELLETVLDDPSQNRREKLLEIAENIHRRYE
ncbi:MAG: HD domain-containing protein [Treponema sp.]|jgi:putative nucleotidyltransferase with HDIG domain|nr:HD domain-containing protein [Treponema sp.]